MSSPLDLLRRFPVADALPPARSQTVAVSSALWCGLAFSNGCLLHYTAADDPRLVDLRRHLGAPTSAHLPRSC